MCCRILMSLQTFLCVLTVCGVCGQLDCPYDGDLSAYTSPSITIFNQSLSAPYDPMFQRFSRERQMICKWTIKTENSEQFVRLNFTSFHLLSGSPSDCVSIYDGSSPSSPLLAMICDKLPEPVYNSTARYMTVKFTQGSQAGQRWFAMNYTSFEKNGTGDELFWDSTAGRVISFGIIIMIFCFFSFVFKGCKSNQAARDMCRCVGDICDGCLRGCCSVVDKCCNCINRGTSAARDRVQGLRSRTEVVQSQPASGDTGSVRSSVRERSDTEGDTDSVWTSTTNGDGPNLSAYLHSEESGNQDPTAPPAYHLAVQLPPTVSAPPDAMAPPAYESSRDIPLPPSYDSLFNNSSKA